MKLPNFLTSETSVPQSKQAMRGGGYSLVITAVVLAIVVAVNVLAGVLPTAWTRLDMSASKLYSITSNTKVVVNSLQEDVTIYWIVQADAEDAVIENLLSKYESLSDHITVVKKNPDVYPTFAQQYTDETVMNNSLVVECGDKSRYIAYTDIYLMEYDSYSYTYTADSFDGEGAITSAIDYVVSEELPQVYVLEGHGEADLPSTFAEQIEKDNMVLTQFSLLTVEVVPEEADCVLIYAPESDISEEEKEKLSDYIAGGGKVMVSAGPLEDTVLTNLNGLLNNYGVTVQEGIVVDMDQNHYYYGYPYVLMPDRNAHAITDPLIEDSYYALMSLSNGLTVSGATNATVTELLTTSADSYTKADGYAFTTYDKEENDVDGPFAVAVAVEDTGGGELIWFSSSEFLLDEINAYSSGANVNMAMNALTSLIGESEAIAIRSKSLDYNYLTISDTTSTTLKMLMIGLIPMAYFAVGVGVVMNRRRVQHGTV